MSQQLFIHIGLPKTGTTSLQFFMHRNKAGLKKRGIYYPATMREPLPTATQHRYINEAMREEQRRAKQGHAISHDVIRRLLHEITNQGFQTNIISEELFSWEPSFAAPYLARLRDKVDAKVVVFLRRQDTWCESMYAQSIRGGYQQSFANFTDARATTERMDYRHFLNIWAGAFGKENIIVRPYVDRVTKTHVEMLSIIGIPDFEFEGSEDRNPSLTGEAISFIIGLDGLSRANFPKFNRLFGTRLAEVTRKGSPVFFTPENRLKFMEGYTPINEWVVREYLGKDPAEQRLFDLNPADFPAADRISGAMTDARRVEILLQLLCVPEAQVTIEDDTSLGIADRVRNLTAQLDRACTMSQVDC